MGVAGGDWDWTGWAWIFVWIRGNGELWFGDV